MRRKMSCGCQGVKGQSRQMRCRNQSQPRFGAKEPIVIRVKSNSTQVVCIAHLTQLHTGPESVLSLRWISSHMPTSELAATSRRVLATRWADRLLNRLHVSRFQMISGELPREQEAQEGDV